MNQLIIISGPTACSKTNTSILLAEKIQKELQTETAIINFDSLLFYKEISIGTAKPTIDERKNIPHYLIDIESIYSPLTAADFVEKAKIQIYSLHNKKILPILVGGSAFYLRALLKGMYENTSSSSENTKNELEVLYKSEGIFPFIDFLKQNDPEALTYLHPNDHYRIIRAVEYYKSSGEKISDIKKTMDLNNPYDFSNISHPWRIFHIYLDLPKELHFEIIKHRTQKMFHDGILNEIESIKNQNSNLNAKPLASIGYKEAIEYLNKNFNSIEECIERVNISTRQLAKSQRTFFKKITPKYQYNPINDQEKIFQDVKNFLME